MKINDIERYEIIAHAFYRMTQMMAPGKSAPHEHGFSMERREEAWRHWMHTHGRVIDALLSGLSHVMGDEDRIAELEAELKNHASGCHDYLERRNATEAALRWAGARALNVEWTVDEWVKNGLKALLDGRGE